MRYEFAKRLLVSLCASRQKDAAKDAGREKGVWLVREQGFFVFLREAAFYSPFLRQKRSPLFSKKGRGVLKPPLSKASAPKDTLPFLGELGKKTPSV